MSFVWKVHARVNSDQPIKIQRSSSVLLPLSLQLSVAIWASCFSVFQIVGRGDWFVAVYLVCILSVLVAYLYFLKIQTRRLVCEFDADEIKTDESQLRILDLAKIRWPMKSTKQSRGRILLFANDDTVDSSAAIAPAIQIPMGQMRTDDRLLLATFLRDIGDVEQENWSEFRRQYLATILQNRNEATLLRPMLDSAADAPFWWHLLSVGPRGLLSISGVVYFLAAVGLALSACVNIRWMHGGWFPPIGTYVMIAAASFFLLAILSSIYRTCVFSFESPLWNWEVWISGFLLVTSLIFLPMLIQLIVGWGWHQYPIWVFVFAALAISPTAPFYWKMRQQEKARRRDPAAVSNNFTKSWR